MTVSDRTLMAAALGVLDPGDELALGGALGPGEHLRQSGLAALAEVPLAHPLGAPTATRASRGTLSGDRRARPGDRVSFVLRWPDLPPGARCAVFRRVDQEVQRVYPQGGAWTPLQRFRHRDGAPVLDVVVAPPAGQQWLDVVLVAETLTAEPWPDGSPAWERLHRAFLDGRGYGVTLSLEVG